MHITDPVADMLTRIRNANSAKHDTVDVPASNMSFITREDVCKKIFKEIAPSYAERNGGYTRLVRTGIRRGDAAETAIIELVK